MIKSVSKLINNSQAWWGPPVILVPGRESEAGGPQFRVILHQPEFQESLSQNNKKSPQKDSYCAHPANRSAYRRKLNPGKTENR